jgi:hypothetical protein
VEEVPTPSLGGIQAACDEILKVAQDARREHDARFDRIDAELFDQRAELHAVKARVSKLETKGPPSMRPPAPSFSEVGDTLAGNRRAITQAEWDDGLTRAAGRLSLSLSSKVLALVAGAIVLAFLSIVAIASLKSAYGHAPQVEPVAGPR